MHIKTIASIGPACESKETLEQLALAGMNIARINFSHASEEEARARTKFIREINAEKGTNVKILQDLCGPRIRLGIIEGDQREIHDGETLFFYTDGAPAPQPHEIPIRDAYIHNDVKVGNHMLIDSGKFRTTITEVDRERQRIVAVVEKGGILKSRKGLNFPYVQLTNASPTEKDKQDVILGKELGHEFVALSFVQSAKNVHDLRALLNPDQKIISKVEDPIGVAHIDEIIQASDAIMIARGDMGVELPLEEIPLIQKEIIAKCCYFGKPSIVATQMLLSMVEHPTPTRAEVSDVANAVLDGTDALMLSDETNIGKYPVEAVKTLLKIARRAEQYRYGRKNYFDPYFQQEVVAQ